MTITGRLLACALMAGLALACTRPNPAFWPPDHHADQNDPEESAPDAAAPGLAPRDVAPPDTTVASVPDAEESTDATANPDTATGPDAPPPPGGIALGDPGGSPILRPGEGGDGFSDGCGPGQALVGLSGSSSRGTLPGLTSVRGHCAQLAITGTGPYQVVTTNSHKLDWHGSVEDTRYEALCPQDQVVVGFDGMAGSWIDQLVVWCATVSIDEGPAGYAIKLGPPVRLGTALGRPGLGPMITGGGRCDPGKIAVGIQGASGLAVDRFGLDCARPLVLSL